MKGFVIGFTVGFATAYSVMWFITGVVFVVEELEEDRR